jgi:ribokinase
MPFDVVTIGSATVDHFADTDSELIKIDTRTSHESLIAFPLGSKLLINELRVTTGGGGTNTAVAFSRMGLKTAFLGKIGEDANGDVVMSMLNEEHIQFIGARGGQTGFSVILNSIEDDRSILAFKGCNDHLSPADVKPFKTQWIYLSSMLGESFETVSELIARQGCKVAFNPSNYQAQMGYKKLMALLEHVTLLVVNREEACKLLNRDYAQQWEVEPLLKELSELLPCELFLITDGSRGAFAYDRARYYHGQPLKGLNIVETTGAGDAFASTFTAAIIKGEPVERALDYAMTNSESVLEHKGAKEKLLTWEEVRAMAAAHSRAVEVHD